MANNVDRLIAVELQVIFIFLFIKFYISNHEYTFLWFNEIYSNSQLYDNQGESLSQLDWLLWLICFINSFCSRVKVIFRQSESNSWIIESLGGRDCKCPKVDLNFNTKIFMKSII